MTLNLDTSTWKRVALGDVAAASKEKVDPESGAVERYVAGEHMETNDLKIHRWGEVGDGYLGPAFHRRFHPGQVLYGSRRTYLRKVAVAEFEGVTANTTFVIETKDSGTLLQEFLPFVMTSEPFHAFAIQESKGSVNPYVNWSDIARYEFNLPPLDEQKQLSKLLWATERHRQALHHLAGAMSAAAERFLDHAIVSGNQSVLELADILVGFIFPSADFHTEANGSSRPLLRGINIGVGETRWEPSDTVYWKLPLTDRTSRYVLAAGDIVVPMDRPFTASGHLRWAELQTDEEGALLVQRVARLRPRDRSRSPLLRAIVRSPAFQRSLNGSLTGSFAPHLAHGDFARFRFAVPNPDSASVQLEQAERAERTILTAISRTVYLADTIRGGVFGGTR